MTSKNPINRNHNYAFLPAKFRVNWSTFWHTLISSSPQTAFMVAHAYTHLFREGRQTRCRQVNIGSTWQQWCVMRYCGGNKVFVGTLEHSHITSLLILGEQLPVGMATGTWLKPGARPESQCPEGEHTHKGCPREGKSLQAATVTPNHCLRNGKSWTKTQQKEENIVKGKLE